MDQSCSRVCEKRQLRLSCQFVCPHVSARLPLGGFTRRDFMKICLEIPKLVKTGQICPAVYLKTQVRFVVAGDMKWP
jgi:hypothetical protein